MKTDKCAYKDTIRKEVFDNIHQLRDYYTTFGELRQAGICTQVENYFSSTNGIYILDNSDAVIKWLRNGFELKGRRVYDRRSCFVYWVLDTMVQIEKAIRNAYEES